jgi:hypothetical protein
LKRKTTHFLDRLFLDLYIYRYMKNHNPLCQQEVEKNLELTKIFGDKTEKNHCAITIKTKSGSMKKECNGIGRVYKPFKTLENFIKDAKKIHGDRYDYSRVIYKGNRKKVKIICNRHGEFMQLPVNHICGKRGCQRCGVEKVSIALASTSEKFIKKSKKVHGNLYDYSLVQYKTNIIPVKIICKRHGIFVQSPNVHLSGHGCSKCTHRISKPETEFLDYLKIPMENRDKYITRKDETVHKRYQIDALVGNGVYEFLGNYWHGNPRLFNRNDTHPVLKRTYGEIYDYMIDKFDYLSLNGYKVTYVWEDDWEKFKKSKFTTKLKLQKHDGKL